MHHWAKVNRQSKPDIGRIVSAKVAPLGSKALTDNERKECMILTVPNQFRVKLRSLFAWGDVRVYMIQELA